MAADLLSTMEWYFPYTGITGRKMPTLGQQEVGHVISVNDNNIQSNVTVNEYMHIKFPGMSDI